MIPQQDNSFSATRMDPRGWRLISIVDVLLGGRFVVGDVEPAEVEFEGFYQAELARVVRRIALIVGSVPAAEDIAHDALLQVYRRWDRLDAPGAYLRTVTLNAAFRWLRLQRRETAHADLPDRAAVPATDFVELASQLGRLTPRQRAVIVLRYYDGLSEVQIAEALGCRPGSVGPLLSRARNHLRTEWSHGST